MKKAAISVRNVSVSFRPYTERRPTLRRTLASRKARVSEPVHALDGVSFDIQPGEMFGIIGPNGAGKSTLMRVMARTLKPDSGVVAVNGRTSTLLQLGVGFNVQLSGRRNVLLGGLAAGMSKLEIDERFDDIVGFADLEDAIDRPLKTYSSGMFSRLAFSVAMHLDPTILLLDEILAVGDERFRRKSRAAMTELLERSGTIVLVSHSLPQVEDACDNVAWLEAGRVKAVGPAGEVVASYVEESARIAGGAAKTSEATRRWDARRQRLVVVHHLGGKSIEELAKQHGVAPSRIEKWKKTFLVGGLEGLQAENKRVRAEQERSRTVGS